MSAHQSPSRSQDIGKEGLSNPGSNMAIPRGRRGSRTTGDLPEGRPGPAPLPLEASPEEAQDGAMVRRLKPMPEEARRAEIEKERRAR